jgi:uncharacterized protein
MRTSPRFIALIWLLTVVLLSAAAAPAQAPAEQKIQVLIITGQNNHDWRSTTPMLRDILERTGIFEVRVTEEFRGATPPFLEPYDVVVLNYSDWRRKGLRWGGVAEETLLEYVRGGKGLVSFHFSASAFEGWDEYDKLVGGTWRTGQGGHAIYHPFRVEIKDKEHPITAGMAASYPQSDELYNNLRWQPDVHVLATAFDNPQLERATGKHEPMLWVKPYGKGRVFGTALGHDPQAMKSEIFRISLVRGTEWAARGKVSLPVK